MSEAVVDAVRQQLQVADRIMLVSHIRPDGDAVGSLLGLGLALEAVGKNVQMILTDRVPASFRHLPGADRVRTKPEGQFDYIIVLDCSDLIRTGKALVQEVQAGAGAEANLPTANNGGEPLVDRLIPDLNIDHHITNLNFAKTNLVEVGAVATAEILAKHMAGFGLPVTGDVASALLTGIMTDTLGFRTSNMNPDVLRLAADLMDAGADLSTLYRYALLDRSFEAARFWGEGLIKIQREGTMVWTTLSLEDREKANYPGRDDADLINVVASIEDAEIALIFVEQPNHSTKVSWRAQPGFDVSQVALMFGGGGHKAASGADIPGPLEEVQEKVLAATRLLLNPS